MGALVSHPKYLEQTNTKFSDGRHYPYYGNPFPEEASRAEQDSKTHYADFYEKACCISHRDGCQVIVYWIPDKWENPRETPAWAVKRLKKMYETLSSDHARIVRYNGALDGAIGGEYKEKIGGLLLEKVMPGPIHLMALPALTTPEFATSQPKKMLALSLYYRWALQALSAMSFFHHHGTFLRVFSSQMVWLRPNFSLAITGFINAVTETEFPHTESPEIYLRDQPSREYYHELPREDDGMVRDEYTFYEEYGKELPHAKEDLFQWATFVWRLMTTGEETNSAWPSEPNSPRPDDPVADYGQNADTLQTAMLQRAAHGVEWQGLEAERLGQVLLKAWSGGYGSAEKVMEDVRAAAEKFGIHVVGDEVDIGRAWEDEFEVVERKRGVWNRELRLMTSNTVPSDGWKLV